MHRRRPYVMVRDRGKKTLDERFTDFADSVSELMGKWWVTGISVLAVLVWLAIGPFMRFSDSWQLAINTPTTVLEMWLAFILAAAANRLERRNREMLEQQNRMLEHNLWMHQRQLDLLERVDELLKQGQQKLSHIEDKVD